MTVDKAALRAAFAQMLAHYYLNRRPCAATPDLCLVCNYNRFQACRFGFDASLIDPYDESHANLHHDLIVTLKLLAPHAEALGSSGALNHLLDGVAAKYHDAYWLCDALKKRARSTTSRACKAISGWGKKRAPEFA